MKDQIIYNNNLKPHQVPIRALLVERDEKDKKKSPLQLAQERKDREYIKLRDRLLNGETIENSIDLYIPIKELHQRLLQDGYNALIQPPIGKNGTTKLFIDQ